MFFMDGDQTYSFTAWSVNSLARQTSWRVNHSHHLCTLGEFFFYIAKVILLGTGCALIKALDIIIEPLYCDKFSGIKVSL